MIAAPYVTTLDDGDSDNYALTLSHSDQVIEVVNAYWSLPEGHMRLGFYNEQSEGAREVIDQARIANRAALLGGIEASRRPLADWRDPRVA